MKKSTWFGIMIGMGAVNAAMAISVAHVSVHVSPHVSAPHVSAPHVTPHVEAPHVAPARPAPAVEHAPTIVRVPVIVPRVAVHPQPAASQEVRCTGKSKINCPPQK